MVKCNKGNCRREGNYMEFPTHQYVKVEGRRYDLCPDHWGEYRSWLLSQSKPSEAVGVVGDGVDPLKQHQLDYDDFNDLTIWISGRNKSFPKRSDRDAA